MVDKAASSRRSPKSLGVVSSCGAEEGVVCSGRGGRLGTEEGFGGCPVGGAEEGGAVAVGLGSRFEDGLEILGHYDDELTLKVVLEMVRQSSDPDEGPWVVAATES